MNSSSSLKFDMNRRSERPARLHSAIFAAIGALAILCLTSGVSAQVADWSMNRGLMSREALQELRSTLELTANSSEFDDEVRERARQELQLLNTRLESGDFHAGDQLAIEVESEDQFSGTFVVMDGQRITLPVIGEVPLAGVLRSEVGQHLESHFGKFIREPVVSARSLTRVAILGAVGQPGFYVVSPDAVLADVIMTAGGPVDGARLDRTTVQRGQTPILTGQAVQVALNEGQSLDRMGVQSGDQIVVPARSEIGGISLVTMLITGIPTVILAVISIANAM
jgi:protein involved in polysaccharide export with SLBB domain